MATDAVIVVGVLGFVVVAVVVVIGVGNGTHQRGTRLWTIASHVMFFRRRLAHTHTHTHTLHRNV